MNASYYDYYLILPKGKDTLMDYYGDFGHMPPSPKKCVCGADKTFGADCPPEYHSDYCPKSPLYKEGT